MSSCSEKGVEGGAASKGRRAVKGTVTDEGGLGQGGGKVRKSLKSQVWQNDGPIHRTGSRGGDGDGSGAGMLVDILGENRAGEKGPGRSCGRAGYTGGGGRRSSVTPQACQVRYTHVNIYLEPF